MSETLSKSITSQWRFDLMILALGALYVLLNLGLAHLSSGFDIDPFYIRTVLGLLAISPVLMAIHLLNRRQEALRPDEYLQALLLRQTVFTSLWAIAMGSFFGFYFNTLDAGSGSPPYFIFGLSWFIMWPAAGWLVKHQG